MRHFEILIALCFCAGCARAADISGTITSTLTITENSRLVGDVICTVSGSPCLDIAAANVTLELNGFSITGLGDAQTGCAGSNSPGAEHGIRILNQTGGTIHGPGVVQRFRAHGILINGSSGNTITGVTTSTNCEAGILVGGGSNVLENNISIANGNLTIPCGGI
ncbi:MAG TPA: NosD domain-containing protein [Bryobacteraceae bacterium]|jgi:hypothetical protein